MYKLLDGEKRIGIFKFIIFGLTICVGILGSFAVSYSERMVLDVDYSYVQYLGYVASDYEIKYKTVFNGLTFSFGIALTLIVAFVLLFLFYGLECIICGLNGSKYVSQNSQVKVNVTKKKYSSNLANSGIWKCQNCGTFNPSKNEKCYSCETPK